MLEQKFNTMPIIKFEQQDSTNLESVFGQNEFHARLCAIAEQLEAIDTEGFKNMQTFREVVALKCVLVKAIELSSKIDKTYKDNI